MLETCPIEDAFVQYQPTIVGNAIYLGFFALLLIAQIIQLVRYRTLGFSIGLFCGISLEIVGYVGRILLHDNPFDLNSFIIYLVCLTIAPAFIMASIYITIGRIVIAYGTQHSRVKPRDYAIICVVCDIISLILQAAGGGIAAVSVKSDGNDVLLGTHIMVAGLAFQLFSTLLFAVLVADFARRVRNGDRNPGFVDLTQSGRWKGFLIALVVATVCVLVRSAFRVDELQGGFGSEVANNQTLFMVFEGPFIIVACLALTLFHPGFGFHGKWALANWTFSGKTADSEMMDVRGI